MYLSNTLTLSSFLNISICIKYLLQILKFDYNIQEPSFLFQLANALFPSRMASKMNTSRREKITWQAAKKWIETNSASNYGMQNVHSEQDLLYALKDGKILLRILGYHAQREGKVKDDSLNSKINNR